MKPDKGLILNLFETNGKNDILNILIPSWSLLEPLGAQSLPLDSAAPGTRTTRAWTASQRNVKIGYATGVLAIAPNQQDVPGCTGKHANYKGLLIFLQGIQDYSGMTFHPRMRTFVPGHCRSPRKGRFNCESLTSFSGWPVYLAQKVANKTC